MPIRKDQVLSDDDARAHIFDLDQFSSGAMHNSVDE